MFKYCISRRARESLIVTFLWIISIAFCGQVQAATYTLPAQLLTSPFSSCVFSSGVSYTCGSISVPLGTVVNFSSSMTLNSSGFVTSTSVTISSSQGVAVNINVASGSGINIGNSSTITANLSSGDTMTVGNNVSIVGNVSATGNSIGYGTNSNVIGNTVSDSQTFGSGSFVYGTCAATSTSCINPPIDWHFDELSLSGLSGEVKDNSSNGFNGTSSNVSVASTAEVCGGSIFNGSNSDVQVASTAAINTTFTSATTLSFSIWAKPAVIQASKLVQRGDVSGYGLGLSATLGWQATFNVGGSAFIASMGTLPTLNTWYHVVGVFNGSKVYLYVNGVLKSSTTASGSLSSTSNLPIAFGSAVGSKYFNGVLDESLIFNQALTATQVSAIYANEGASKNWNGSPRTCGASTIDHVEFVHNGNSLTCAAKPITVLACKTSISCNGVAANQYTSGNFTVSPAVISGAQWCSDSLCANKISGSISLANNSTIYLSDTTAGSITIGGSVTGATTSVVQCTNTSTSAFNSTSACVDTNSSSGFLVSIPNHTSCSSQNVTIQAVQSSATANTCIPAFQGVTKNISLYSGYTNPTTGTKTASFNYVTTSGGVSSGVASLSTSFASPTNLAGLYFDSTGTAKLTGFSYPDVGQVALYPTYTGSSGTNDAGLSMVAISGNAFIASPASFVFGAVSTPQVAGSPFNVSITASNGCTTPTAAPNFGRETTPATVSLTSVNPLPSAGNSIAISQTLTGFSGGSATASITWKEVGTFDLVASNVNYLSSGVTTSSTKSAVGRFIPSYFDTAITPFCSVFTYSGQPFTTTVTARATGGSIAANYAGLTWAKVVTLSDVNAIAGAFSANAIPPSSFASGVGATSSTFFTFSNSQTIPSTIKVKAVDTDGVSSATGTQGTNYLRSGRLRMLNAYGSELLALPVSSQAQYWAGTGYVLNTLDSCTSLVVPTSSSGLVFGTGNLTAGKTAAKINGVSSGVGSLVSGDAGFTLSAPGSGATGYVDATITAPSWLQYNWKGAGNVSPSARATFGTYKSPLVYMRENY